MFRRKSAIERRYNFPPRLISVSALPCKTGNTKIAPFHLNVVCFFANKHTKHTKIISWSQTACPLFIKRSTVCTKHDQHRAQSIQPSDMHRVGVRHVCHDIGRHVSYERILANSDSQWTLSVRYLTTLSQQMLTAVKHVADKFCFQQDSILTHHACNTLKLKGANSQLHLFL